MNILAGYAWFVLMKGNTAGGFWIQLFSVLIEMLIFSLPYN